jgi:predicted lipoprotein with Yx(FWY)xxD motif
VNARLIRVVVAGALLGGAVGALILSDSSLASASKTHLYVVTTENISGLGVILVDGAGQALYAYSPDHHSGKSKCNSACADEWPPLLLPKGVTTPVSSGKAKASLLGTSKRIGGSTQVTYNGWPLYRFATDETPGSAPGEGLDNLGGYWYVLSAKGKEIH